MCDYISRNAITQVLNTMDRYVADELTLCDTEKKFPRNEVFVVDDVYEEIIEQLPPADVRENIYGVWIHYNDEFYSPDRLTPVLRHIVECSVCHHKIADFHGLMNFCTNCGCQMDKENNNVNE